jgi:hypothetical protein
MQQATKGIPFLEWLHSADLATLEKGGVLWFYGAQAQPLFMAQVLAVFKNRGFTIQTLDEESLHEPTLLSRLAIPSLTTHSLLWLSDLMQVDKKVRTNVLKVAQRYQGPQWLGFFIDQMPSIAMTHAIELEGVLDRKQALAFWRLLWQPQTMPAGASKLLNVLGARYPALSLDAACLLQHYAHLVDPSAYGSLLEWLPELFVQEQSLYTLASHFFARKSSDFFSLWSIMKSSYSEQFWTVFWSEQLFRAYWFIYYQQEHNVPLAQKVGMRLPFSFLKKDYVAITMSELQQAHEELYNVDWGFKNGQTLGLELVYLKFMLKNYNKS